MEAFNEKIALAASSLAQGNYQKEAVSAVIPQGFDHKINIRIVAGTEFEIKPREKKCMPRKGADRRDTRPLDLPPEFEKNFPDINRKVMAWLNQSAEHAHLFLEQPVESLIKAGVKLSREDQKHLSRNVEEVKSMAMVSPGVRVTHFTAGTSKGKVTKEEKKPEKTKKGDKDCGCS